MSGVTYVTVECACCGDPFDQAPEGGKEPSRCPWCRMHCKMPHPLANTPQHRTAWGEWYPSMRQRGQGGK